MRVSVGQIYTKPGVSFPFSHRMQRWLSEELSRVAGADSASAEFLRRYGVGFELVVRIGADTQIVDNEIRGPTVFKKDRSVEFSVFLPFDVIVASAEGCRVALEYMLDGIRAIFCQAGIDPERLEEKKTFFIERICSDPAMLKTPWPHS